MMDGGYTESRVVVPCMYKHHPPALAAGNNGTHGIPPLFISAQLLEYHSTHLRLVRDSK